MIVYVWYCYSCDKNRIQCERLAFILCNNYHEQLWKNSKVNRKIRRHEEWKGKAEQEENYHFVGFIAFSKFKFVCAQKWRTVRKKSFCMRNPEQMTAFECISYLKAFPFPDEFTRLRRRRWLCCIMRNQFHLLSLFLSYILFINIYVLHLPSTIIYHSACTYTHAHNLHYRLYLTYDSVLFIFIREF